MTRRQREVLADKVCDAANLVAGALVVGFFLGDPRASAGVLLGGIAMWAAGLIAALILTKEGR